MIHIGSLRFHYPQSDFQLSVDRLDVERGMKVAMVGPSGSGKTTLLHLIAGILTPTAGSVTNGETEVSTLGESARRDFRLRHVGLVFQEFELLEHLNVLDNILLPCRISSSLVLGQEQRDRAATLAREMDIGDKLRRNVRRLSQGERQRVAICRALLLEPALLLCDEPTGNLDPLNKQHVLQILWEYIEQHGTTLLAVTHDHELLDRFDRTIDVKQFHEF